MGEKAPRRWYSCLMIIICIRMVLQAAISFRGAPKAIHIVFSEFSAVKDQAIPTDKTVARWLTQVGLYKLNCHKEKAEDWALIVDNSVQIGTKKCLVILGVRLSKFKGKALTFEDMEILVIELHDKSDAKIVCRALERAQKKVGKVAMVCADDGTDLRGGINLFCKKHEAGRVFDITHKIGTYLKKILEKDSEWKVFSSAAAAAKKKMQQTPAAHLMPPNQRTKSRFLNIEILIRWAVAALEVLEDLNHPDRELLEKYCGWLRQHKKLLERLKQLDCVSQKTRQFIRENGLSTSSGELLDAALDMAMEPLGYNLEACEYAGQLIDFVKEQSKIVPVGQIWIASSEVIESLFGKLKCLEHDQSKGGFTSLVLGAAACVGKLDADIITRAMDQITTMDVKTWTDEQIGETVLTKRRKAFRGSRKKESFNSAEQESAGFPLGEAMGF